MEKTSLKWLKAVMFGLVMVAFTACDDSNEPQGKGEVEFEITDAPSDDANIKSVMVTVAEVKVNGQSISGFTKQTIDLKAYQEGNTKLLGSAQLDAKTYNNITLVLDLDSDAQGNSPGCYVLTKDNAKFKLKSTTTGKADVVINQSWRVTGNTKTRVLLDFDLRKSIRYVEDAAVRYSFVADSKLNTAVRVVVKENAGTIKGSFENNSGMDAETVVVYAYKKGTFNASMETQADEDGIQFSHAVASAMVKSTITGNVYTLAFLEQGEYELHFVAYQKNTETGRYTFSGRLESETEVNGSVSNIIKVNAGASVNVSATVKGLI